MSFLLFNLVIVVLVFILLFILSGIWPPDSPWAPWWQIPEDTVRKMCKLAKVNEKSLIYDLGSGTGNALILAAREFGARGVGIEIDPIRYYISLGNRRRYHAEDKVVFLKKNFFHVPLFEATAVFMYLIPAALKRLTPKFLKEIQPGTIVVSYKYEMPVEMFNKRLHLIKHDEMYEIFVYKMSK